MKSFSMQHLVFLLLSVILGCAEHGFEDKNQKKLPHINSIGHIDELILKEIQKEKRSCDYEKDFSNCPMTELSFSSLTQTMESEGQRILILDSEGLIKSALWPHRKHLVNIYEVDGVGIYKKIPVPQLQIPVLLKNIFNILKDKVFSPLDILSSAPYIMNLIRKSRFLDELRLQKGSPVYESHASRIFEWLTEFNPDSQIIKANYPYPPLDLYCAFDDANNMEVIKNFYISSAYSLLEMIESYKIHWINLSWGTTLNQITQFIRRDCNKIYIREDDPKTLELLDVHKLFLQILSKSQKVIIIQSVPNSLNHMAHAEKNIDAAFCLPMQNVIRVGYVNEPNLQIRPEGIPIRKSLIPDTLKNLHHCIDIYVNSGINQDASELHYEKNPTEKLESILWPKTKNAWWNEHSLFYNYHGIYLYPMDFMATSWASPLGLSFLNFISKIKNKKLSSEDSVKEFWEESLMEMKGKIFDPLKNKQLLKFLKSLNESFP